MSQNSDLAVCVCMDESLSLCVCVHANTFICGCIHKVTSVPKLRSSSCFNLQFRSTEQRPQVEPGGGQRGPPGADWPALQRLALSDLPTPQIVSG